LGCKPQEVVFTSAGSESNNHALKGVYFSNAKPYAHIITTQVEHPAILNPCRFLERLGAAITYLPVDGFGRVDPDVLRCAITPHTALISVMHATVIRPDRDSGPLGPSSSNAVQSPALDEKLS
jgi:cysteine desulfurase